MVIQTRFLPSDRLDHVVETHESAHVTPGRLRLGVRASDGLVNWLVVGHLDALLSAAICLGPFGPITRLGCCRPEVLSDGSGSATTIPTSGRPWCSAACETTSSSSGFAKPDETIKSADSLRPGTSIVGLYVPDIECGRVDHLEGHGERNPARGPTGGGCVCEQVWPRGVRLERVTGGACDRELLGRGFGPRDDQSDRHAQASPQRPGALQPRQRPGHRRRGRWHGCPPRRGAPTSRSRGERDDPFWETGVSPCEKRLATPSSSRSLLRFALSSTVGFEVVEELRAGHRSWGGAPWSRTRAQARRRRGRSRPGDEGAGPCGRLANAAMAPTSSPARSPIAPELRYPQHRRPDRRGGKLLDLRHRYSGSCLSSGAMSISLLRILTCCADAVEGVGLLTSARLSVCGVVGIRSSLSVARVCCVALISFLNVFVSAVCRRLSVP